MLDIADALADAVLGANEAVVRRTGTCPQPQVHILAEDRERPYLGYVVCRRFRRGPDAASAVVGLGLLPSTLRATRLIVAWEELDLRGAMQVPTEQAETGFVLVDARLDTHVLRWHPFQTQAAPEGAGETATLRWGAPARYERIPLPDPIEAMLTLWREFRDGDLEETAAHLQRAGYELHWAGSRDRGR